MRILWTLAVALALVLPLGSLALADGRGGGCRGNCPRNDGGSPVDVDVDTDVNTLVSATSRSKSEADADATALGVGIGKGGDGGRATAVAGGGDGGDASAGGGLGLGIGKGGTSSVDFNNDYEVAAGSVSQALLGYCARSGAGAQWEDFGVHIGGSRDGFCARLLLYFAFKDAAVGHRRVATLVSATGAGGKGKGGVPGLAVTASSAVGIASALDAEALTELRKARAQLDADEGVSGMDGEELELTASGRVRGFFRAVLGPIPVLERLAP